MRFVASFLGAALASASLPIRDLPILDRRPGMQLPGTNVFTMKRSRSFSAFGKPRAYKAGMKAKIRNRKKGQWK